MSLIDNAYQSGSIVINIKGEDFGGKLKMGDLIGTINVLQYMRDKNKNQNIKFYVSDSDIQQGKLYVKQFKDFLQAYSNYLSPIPGQFKFDGFVEIWSFRELNGEFVKIENTEPTKKKICIFPLFDAAYNTERNWSPLTLQQIIESFSEESYANYEKYICLMGKIPDSIDTKNFLVSREFTDNLNHVIECEYYIGGDTGFSHFVSVLNNPNRKLSYYYNSGYHGGWRSVFTAPFYVNNSTSKMIYFNNAS